jgi:hypothetical protein
VKEIGVVSVLASRAWPNLETFAAREDARPTGEKLKICGLLLFE